MHKEHVENKPANSGLFYEVIDAEELAKRLRIPQSWVRDGTRARCADPIPCLRFGRYVRFQWLAPELESWIARHKCNSRKPPCV